jgi:hypothetical protein
MSFGEITTFPVRDFFFSALPAKIDNLGFVFAVLLAYLLTHKDEIYRNR